MIFALVVVLIYLVQRFWFLKAWYWIGTLTSSALLANSLRALLIALVVLLFAAILNPFFGRFLSRFSVGQLIVTFASLWIITSLFGFIAVKSVDGIESLVTLVARFRGGAATANFDPARRTFFHYAALVAGSLPFIATTYGFAAGRLRYKVERIDVPILNLPKELDGLRIAQLSDIHIGSYMPPHEIARAVEMANDLDPHLSVVTGDFISSRGDPLETCIDELSKLKAPLGVWGCNGNHEIYAEAEDAAERLFQQKEMRLLRAQSAVIQHNGASFNLIGVDYQRDRMVSGGSTGPMLHEIESQVRRDMPNILMSHNPNSFPRAAQLGIELSLAGHTHGGQVKVEIVDHTVTPARLITPFVAGLYHLPMGQLSAISRQPSTTSHNVQPLATSNGRAKSALYVNRGLGTFGFPVRLGVPPEITLLTLRRA